MTYKQALVFNSLNAVFCYIGLIFGILLGENVEFINPWIYAIAGGMFLYIAFCDMVGFKKKISVIEIITTFNLDS